MATTSLIALSLADIHIPLLLFIPIALVGAFLVGDWWRRHKNRPKDQNLVDLFHESVLWKKRWAKERQDNEGNKVQLAKLGRLLERTRKFGGRGQLAFHSLRRMSDPIQGILGLAEFLESSISETEGKEDAEILKHEALKLRHILEQLLSLGFEEEAGPNLEPMDLSTALQEVLASLHPQFKEMGIVHEIQAPAGKIIVHGDPQFITRYILNLVRAGLDLATKDFGTLRFEIQSSFDDILLRMTVQDPLNKTGAKPPSLDQTQGDKHPRNGEAEYLNLPFLQSLAECFDGSFQARNEKENLVLDTRIPVSPIASPLPGPKTSAYLASSNQR
jgi:signal transduction histidine kinase